MIKNNFNFKGSLKQFVTIPQLTEISPVLPENIKIIIFNINKQVSSKKKKKIYPYFRSSLERL